MPATIIPFPLIEGAFCAVLMSHRKGCGCPNCRKAKRHRAYELDLAEKVARELDEAIMQRESMQRRTAQLERDAG